MNFYKTNSEEYNKQLKYFNDYYGAPFRKGQGTEEILDLINKYNLAGAGFWSKDREANTIWSIIAETLNIN